MPTVNTTINVTSGLKFFVYKKSSSKKKKRKIKQKKLKPETLPTYYEPPTDYDFINMVRRKFGIPELTEGEWEEP